MRNAVAVVASLDLESGTDTRAPGGAVTTELCGDWEHDGSCRWPHNSQIEAHEHAATLRTIVIVSENDQPEVVGRIERALRDDPRWTLNAFAHRPPTRDELPLAERLART